MAINVERGREMLLNKEKLQHINSIAHEGKVVVLATDGDGKIWYTVKQDGFEDSYLNTPANLRTGWENWQELEFPNETKKEKDKEVPTQDQSVIDKETAELTYQNDTKKFVLKSLYQTKDKSAVAPVQLVSALGHIYVFRQSKSNTLLVDRFVLDGMTNKLNRKLEVRFKRSKQKHTPTKNMNKGSNGLVNIDSLDFRDANGNFFYQPTTELCLVNNLQKGWFSVVLVPTIENDVYRWHIFAYNSQTQKVELTTIRASEEGLFDVKDYSIFEELNDTLVPRNIPGVIKRTLDISNVTVTNGLAATKYDLQQEQETQSGEMQLIKTATRLMLAIPTDKGTAAFSFAIAGDGTLSQINQTPTSSIIRSKQREILLPLNTLDEIKAFGDKTPPPQGIITGLAEGTDKDKAEDLVKISTNTAAAELKNGDLVKITSTRDYRGLYRTTKVDNNSFEINLPSGNGLGYWEKEDQEAGGLIFDGMITAYEKTADGKLRVSCPNHGLANGDEVQIVGTDGYNNTYPVQKIDNTHFVIERKWAAGEAVKAELLSKKRRGVVFDGNNDYIQLSQPLSIFSGSFTVSMWVKVPKNSKNRGILLGDYQLPQSIDVNFEVFNGKLRFYWNNQPDLYGSKDLRDNEWHFISFVRDRENKKIYAYVDGVADINHSGEISDKRAVTPHRIGRDSRDKIIPFEGQIAEVRIWKVARTAEEIKNNMYLQLTGKEVGLVGYWRLGGISEGKVIDFSVNGNDGTVYGDAYVSAATLNRKLTGGTDAVKYSNPELFAVSERATYEESFEFKVNFEPSKPVNLTDLNNADNRGNKIFTLAYWGKSSRSAEEKKPISAVQNEFETSGNGWYRVSCNVTIPDGVSLLRSFEIANVKGTWKSLEIRKHSIRLLSDSITEAKFTDVVNLTPLAASQAELAVKLKQLELKEQQEAVLLKEKRELEDKLAKLNNLNATITEKDALSKTVQELRKQNERDQSNYDKEKNNPLNYWCYIENKATGLALTPWVDSPYNFKNSLVFLNRVNKVHFHWNFIAADNGCFVIKNKAIIMSYEMYMFWGVFANHYDGMIGMMHLMDESYLKQNPERREFKLIDAGQGFYYIQARAANGVCKLAPANVYQYQLVLVRQQGSDHEKFKLVKVDEQSINGKVEILLESLNGKQANLRLKELELAKLINIIEEGVKNKTTWENRRTKVIEELAPIQREISNLNGGFINGVSSTQQTPQTMRLVAKDGKGLVTQGALLGFVQPASRLNAIETCEGNVQLSYFDTQGRMRQTNYDATADGKNAAFEQWIPDAQRACLNFSNRESIVRLDKALALPPDWTIEAWFVYPLPEPGKSKYNSLTTGEKADHHIIVKDGKELGIFLTNDPLGHYFYDSGFNLELLPQGWHHLAAIGKGNTTLFYIDGKKVGDTKAKALTASEEALKAIADKNSEAYKNAEKKVKDIKNANLKSISDVYAIANNINYDQQFRKVAEVRIWGIALTDDEIAINSKTLISGNEPGLLAYYPLNEATGTTIRDNSGNGKNGTVSGASWWGCTAPIGNPGNTVMKFDGVNDYVNLGNPSALQFANNCYTLEAWIKPSLSSQNRAIISKWNSGSTGWYIFSLQPDNTINISHNISPWTITSSQTIPSEIYSHVVATYDGSIVKLYINGQLAGSGNLGKSADTTTAVLIGAIHENGTVSKNFFLGQIAEVRIWNKARTQVEIQADMYKRLSGNEANLVAYYPLNEIKREGTGQGTTQKVLDLAGNNHGTVHKAITVYDNTLPLVSDALVSNEYSTVTLEDNLKVAIMRRFFAYPTANGATLLPDKRVEALELRWIGNAQFAPTLLGYIEGAPPIPSENLTLEEDYNGATSVELTMSDDVTFSWKRSQDSGLGGSLETFLGADMEASTSAGVIVSVSSKVAVARAGFKGNFDFNYQFQNESSIASSSSLSMTDKLELRGTTEESAKFPHLGKRFIPKNVGYALVVSALADMFVTRLARSGKMVGYQVQPVDGIPPDVNTITFLINPAYTMNGSLDGLTGSSATSDRFFKHVPEMRSQYGSLYPASYYRLQEAYDLKRQIEAEDKRRESYFSNFNVRMIDEWALDRQIDSGAAPNIIGVDREEDKPQTSMTEEEKKKAEEEKKKAEQEKLNQKLDSIEANTKQQQTATKKKQAEIQSKISDQEQRVHATDSFAGWQKRMEDIQIRAGKRNIVNTYVWDADGGLHAEAQSFANTVEHTIGGSFSMNAGYGFEGKYGAFGMAAELTAQATVNLTQTMSKTEARSKGFQLNVDLGGLEHKGITNYNDRPILPGEKVDRYRFMSFYLEGSTQNFQDFFNYVVDPEWLASNGEEARALRQAQAGKPNKAWRVLHRVTYVERPALMGFGQGIRRLKPSSVISDNQILIDKIAELEAKIKLILNAVQNPASVKD
ncbi:MAG: LamG-like jellyroll fold domain-containing protein [Gloeotrichia echinulata CP02]